MPSNLSFHGRALASDGWTAGVAVAAGVLVGSIIGEGSPGLYVVGAVVITAAMVAILREPRYGLMLLAAFVVTRVSDVAVERYDSPSLMQPLLAVLLLGVVWQSVWHRHLPTGLGRPALLLGAYGVVLGLGLFTPVDQELASFYFGAFVRDAVIALAAVALTRTVRTLEQVIWVIVGCGLVLSAMGVYQYTTGDFSRDFGGFARASVLNIVGSTEDYRLSGPIADPNHYAQFLTAIVPLAAGRMLWGRSLAARLVAGAALFCLVLAVVFTFSRGAFLALAVLGLLFMLRLRPPATVWLGMGAVAAVLLVLLPRSFTERLLSLTGLVTGGGGGEASLSGRLSAQLAGIDMFLDHPVLGVGVGQFSSYYAAYARGQGVNTASGGLEPHNLYLEVAAETGVVGLVAFTAILVVAFWRLASARRALEAAGGRAAAHLVGDLRLALIGYLLCGLFVHNAYPRVFWLLIGLSFAVTAVTESYRRDRAEGRTVLV